MCKARTPCPHVLRRALSCSSISNLLFHDFVKVATNLIRLSWARWQTIVDGGMEDELMAVNIVGYLEKEMGSKVIDVDDVWQAPMDAKIRHPVVSAGLVPKFPWCEACVS